MNKNIEELKYVIFGEWESHRRGSSAWYYDTLSTDYNAALASGLEVMSNIGNNIDWSFPSEDEKALNDDEISELDGEEKLCAELDRLYLTKAPTAEYLNTLHYDGIGVGFDCELIAEGKDILSKALQFLDTAQLDNERYYEDEDDGEEKQEADQMVIERAKQNPDDYDALKDLLDLISWAIELRFEYY